MKIQVSIFDRIPSDDRKAISSAKVNVPVEFDTVNSAEEFLIESLYKFNKNVHTVVGFTHYAHAYLLDDDDEIVSSVFPHGRTFLSLEEAQTFFNDYTKYVSERNS